MDVLRRRPVKVVVTVAAYAAVAAAVVTAVSDGLRPYLPYVAAVASVPLALFAFVWTQGGPGDAAAPGATPVPDVDQAARNTARLAFVFGILGITVVPLAGGVLAWVLARRARRLAAEHGATYPAWLATTAQVLAIGTAARVVIAVVVSVAR